MSSPVPEDQQRNINHRNNEDAAAPLQHHSSTLSTSNTSNNNSNSYKSNFMEFKKEAQKIVQSRSALILVVDPGPPEDVPPSPPNGATSNNNNNINSLGSDKNSTFISPTSSSSFPATTSNIDNTNNNSNTNSNVSSSSSSAPSSLAHQIQVAKKKQELRCAEVDRCCKAICRVLSGEASCCAEENNATVWSEKVASLPLVLINTSSGVSKFRRATRLFNGRSAFLVISEDFFKGVFYTIALDKVKFVDEFPTQVLGEPVKNNNDNNNNNNNDDGDAALSVTNDVVVTPSPFSVLTICEKLLEQKIFNFFKNYEKSPCTLRRTLLGAPRPENDRDDHVGTHSCAFVQETYQEQLRNQESCTLVIYHASSCPACPCALRCTDFIVSFLQQEAARLCTEHQQENHLQDDAEFKSISEIAKTNYPVKSGVVDFCPCGLKKTEKWPLLVCGAMNIEENEIDHSLFPELTVPHFRFFPCGKDKEKRRQIIERSEKCPTFLFDRVREHYFSAAAQYSDGLATNAVFSRCVNIIFARAKRAVEKKLAELCPEVAASLRQKIKEDFLSAGVSPDDEESNNSAPVVTSSSSDTQAGMIIVVPNHTHGTGDHHHNQSSNNNNSNNLMNSEDAALQQQQNNNNNNNIADAIPSSDDMNAGKRIIRPEDIAQRTAEFDSGVRRSREPCY